MEQVTPTELAALVVIDAARLGLIRQPDGTYLWPKHPLWQIEALDASAVRQKMIDLHYPGPVAIFQNPMWIAVNYEAPYASLPQHKTTQFGNKGELQAFTAFTARDIGGTKSGELFPNITDSIAYCEKQWDDRRKGL